MKVKKITLLMVPVLVLLCASVAVAGNVVDYTYDGDGNIGDAVITAQTPTVYIFADPETIQEGASSTLSWTSDNATSCSIDQGIGSVPLSGTTAVSPTETTTYTITATGPGGTSTDSVTVTVAPPPEPEPTVTISADPETIQQGNSSTLTWTSTNATSCSIDQGIGAVDLNGSTSVSPTVTTMYTITATGDGGTAQDSVTVTVTPLPTPQTLTLRPNAAGDNTGISQQSPLSGAHYDKVDDVTADTTTFVCTIISFEEYDLYAIPNHTTESGTINYIKVYYRVRADNSGCFARPVIKTGGTVYYGTLISPATSWTTYNYTWTTNPQTGVAWTWNDIDALQIGIALTGNSGYYLARCTQVYVEVNYTPSQ